MSRAFAAISFYYYLFQKKGSEIDGVRAFGSSAPLNKLPKLITLTRSVTTKFSLLFFATREQENSVVIPNGSHCLVCNLSDTKEVTIEESGPLGLNKKVYWEDKRQTVTAIIKAECMD